MANNINHQKKESMFFHAVSQIVTEEISNSNVSLRTVTGVKLSRDMSHLKVYLTFEKNELRSLENLNKAKGFVRSQLASRINLRKTPEVHFEIDTSFEKGARIDAILAKIKNKEK